MERKVTALVALVVALALVMTALPAPAAAQRNAVAIPIWQSNAYTINQDATVGVLYYYWFARTAEQVREFIEVAEFDVTINGQPVFGDQAAVDRYWSAVENYTWAGQPAQRSQWNYTLPGLAPGTYEVRTVITLTRELSDGVAPQPFPKGVLTDTANTITVTGEPRGEVFSAEPGAAPVETSGDADTDDSAASDATDASDTASDAAADTSDLLSGAPDPAPEPDYIFEDPAVGRFVKHAVAHWAPEPGKHVQPTIVFAPGTTLWVYGMDATRRYYKVLLDAAYLWVPVDSLAPTEDSVWANDPLPNVIVD